MTTTSSTRLGALALGAVLVLSACSSGGASTAPSTAPSAAAPTTAASAAPGSEAPAGASGSIIVSGSSTVEPISSAIAEAFKATNPDFNFTVTGPGTGDGFKTFCKGETDISDASRKIKDEEAATCAAAGIEFVELPIAYDGITIMTSPDTAVDCLSFADLYALTGPESVGFKKWTDASALAKELGSNTVFPDADLAITGPGEESGTYDSYLELVLDAIGTTRKTTDPTAKHTLTRPDYIASPNDNAIIARHRDTRIPRLGRLRLRGGERRHRQGTWRLQGAQRHLRQAIGRDHLRRQLPDLPDPVHLREQGQGRIECSRRGLRRLLPGRRHDQHRPGDRPLRQPACRQAGGQQDCMGRSQVIPSSSNRPDQLGGPAGSSIPAE